MENIKRSFVSEVKALKIIEHRMIDNVGTATVQFFRIDPEDLSLTLSAILTRLMDLSWLSKFDADYKVKAFSSRANKTIADIQCKFDICSDDKVTKDAGEYIVSELAREAIVVKLNYLDIPIGELLGKKKSGNPGFDFHSQNSTTDTIVFGESKYVAATTAYSTALPQMVKFINDGKDIEDLPELEPFCTSTALQRVVDGHKGFAAAFSAKHTTSDKIIENILKRADFQKLASFEEVILVAVNL